MTNEQEIVQLADLSLEVVGAVIALFGGIQLVLIGLAIFLGRIWINRIHEQDRARFTAELEALRAARKQDAAVLQAAIQAFSVSHGVAQERRLNAISEVWKTILRLKEKTPAVVTHSDILTRSEQSQIFTDPRSQGFLEGLDETSVIRGSAVVCEGIEDCRPFVGPILWSLFYAYRALVGRAAWLFVKGKEQGYIEPWYEDSGIRQILGAVIDKSELASFDSLQFGKFQQMCQLLESKILAEADQIISGASSGALGLEQAQRIADAASAYEPGGTDRQ